MDNKPFGYILMLDAAGCSGNITSKDHIQTFVNELVKVMKMDKKGDTIFEYFEDTPFNRDNDIIGYSVVQIISLSNITIHINEISRTIYLDVFTCGNLDEILIRLLFCDYFLPKTLKSKIVVRNALSEEF
jgi:S-adenosylmethionine/arginine decarboxylase-like enzyme